MNFERKLFTYFVRFSWRNLLYILDLKDFESHSFIFCPIIFVKNWSYCSCFSMLRTFIFWYVTGNDIGQMRVSDIGWHLHKLSRDTICSSTFICITIYRGIKIYKNRATLGKRNFIEQIKAPISPISLSLLQRGVETTQIWAVKTTLW